jgi:hypothetical protein
MKFNGTNWVAVGSAGFSPGGVHYTSLVIDKNGTPYVAYHDLTNSGKAVVMKYNGSNWVAVGAVGLSAGEAQKISLAIDKSDNLYIAYRDVPNGYKATVKKFDGTNWVTVGSAGFSAGIIDYTSLKIDNNGTPYVAYKDDANGTKATVMKYNGTSWVTVGTAGFSASAANFTSLAIDNNGVPYVAYRDESLLFPLQTGSTVMKFDGSNWVQVGQKGFSVQSAEYISMAIDNNDIPYVAYADDYMVGKATVMTYDCPAESKLAICAVTTDTVTGRNRILWKGNTVLHVDSFKVYRENSGSYSHIGSVAGNVNNFVDGSGNTATQSYNYRLTLLDSCGRETDVDSAATHKTVRLELNRLSDDTAIIKWNKYEGVAISTYTVKRSDNGFPFTTIASFSIGGNDTTFTDVNVPKGYINYRVEMALFSPCNGYNRITSNAVNGVNVNINEVGGGRQILLVPNPADDELKISIPVAIAQVEVYDLAGKRIILEKGNGKNELAVNVSSLTPGMYLIRLNNTHNKTFIKK